MAARRSGEIEGRVTAAFRKGSAIRSKATFDLPGSANQFTSSTHFRPALASFWHRGPNPGQSVVGRAGEGGRTGGSSAAAAWVPSACVFRTKVNTQIGRS